MSTPLDDGAAVVARRYQYMIRSGTWRRNRSRDDGSGPYAEWCIRFPADADMSCPATRGQEVDALAGKVGNALPYLGPWCCEQGKASGKEVCDECEETSKAYQSTLGPGRER